LFATTLLSDKYGAYSVCQCFGDGVVEQGRRWVRKEGLSMHDAALGAGGLVPVTDSVGVLGLCRGLRVAREEAREEDVASKHVDVKVPALKMGELEDLLAE
jgi:hypothetical protein